MFRAKIIFIPKYKRSQNKRFAHHKGPGSDELPPAFFLWFFFCRFLVYAGQVVIFPLEMVSSSHRFFQRSLSLTLREFFGNNVLTLLHKKYHIRS